MKSHWTWKHCLTLTVVLAGLMDFTGHTEVILTESRDLTASDTSLAGESVVLDGATLTLSGAHEFASLRITRGGKLTHPPGVAGATLRVTGDLVIEAGSAIELDGKGYPVGADRGPGTGQRADWVGTGAGHGGWGGHSANGAEGGAPYGSVLEPAALGSQGGDGNGGPGAPGGGALRLVVNGRLLVDGRLAAEGSGTSVNNAAGGAGGSLWVTAGVLAGTGVISVNGGRGEWVDGGGGSGGRIALYLGANEFAGGITAYGGGGKELGGAGTVYLEGGRDTIGDLWISNGGTWGNVTLVTSPKPFRAHVVSNAVCYAEGPWVLNRLEVGRDAVLMHRTGQSQLEVRTSGDLDIAAGGAIHADGRGYPFGDDRGPGGGVRKDWAGSGGGHGGWGGIAADGGVGGFHHGSVLEPASWGSQGGDSNGGQGAAGGGAIRLVVGGRLTVEKDGRLSANGSAAGPVNNAGGGAGGSLWLTVGTLSGAGLISVDGGAGEWVDGGGGAGGRLALYFAENTFSGSMQAYGGGGSQRGGAGTIYTRKTGSAFGHVLVHNGGTRGNETPLESPSAYQLELAGAASGFPSTNLVLQDLFVGATAVVSPLAVHSKAEIQVLNNLRIDEGGSVHADGRGHPGDGTPGLGAGVRVAWGGSGGGHGGVGGRSASGADGGWAYGSILEPLTSGSQGGFSDSGPGAAGGGVLRLVVAHQLQVDGRLTSLGLGTSVNNAGGGAGGSIFVTAGSLAGSGLISVNGGTGEWVDGGGGAGGRIALYLGQRSFSGSIEAKGSGGSAIGGSGTIYTRIGNETGGELVFDNGGGAGTLSPLDVPSGTRLVLAGGTTMFPTRPQTLESLVLRGNSVLTHTNGQSGLTLTVRGDLTVEAGARLSVGGKGYPVGNDPGRGAGSTGTYCGGGGAYGGSGGIAWPGDTTGGVGYGSVLEPADFGSSGGAGDGPRNARSPGGGAIRLVVAGTLRVEGVVEANGTGAWYNNQGGGAGGSIWITAEKLVGAGSITANGGNGEWVDGGGGGGGRVALYLGSEAFDGITQARGGGSGHQPGGAGTVYRRTGDEAVGRLLIENGDVWGAYTRLVTEEAFDLTVSQRAQVYGDPALVVGRLDLATNAILTHLKGDPYVSVVALRDVNIAGSVNVDGRGYPVAGDAGPGGGGQRVWAGSGAGHGGVGGTSATGLTGGAAYGSLQEPSTWGSQGGSGDGGPGGHGGGAIRILAGGTLAVDGAITANGLNGVANNSGGGAGGSILLGARTLAGGGVVLAKGGAGEWVDGGGGSGGRIALYRASETFTGTIDVAGAGGSAKGADGTLHRSVPDRILWLAPHEGWVNGVVAIEAAILLGETGPVQITFDAWRDGVSSPIGTVTTETAASVAWDTTRVGDGRYAIRLVARGAAGSVLAESTRSVMVNNAVVWHGGVITGNETWDPARVHAVGRDLSLLSGASLALPAGTVVKFLPGIRFRLDAGAALLAEGTSVQPVTLTSFLDDSVGGDSNQDGSESRPVPGSWRLQVGAGAALPASESMRLRYHSQTYGGMLVGDETWTGDSLREIGDDVVVPSGVTLRIEAGALVKFASGRGIDVRAGGNLLVAGSVAQPAVFTSLRDDTWGGDSSDDGTRSVPAAGDWRSLRFEDGSTATLDHAIIRYGGNSVGNPWGAGGVIEALGGPLTVRNSVIADALKDGAFCYGRTRFENCLVLRCDRGLTAVGEMDVIHCTLDENRIGLLEHVGQLNIRNSIISRSIDVGIEHDLGSGVAVVTSCNVWNPDARRGNYNGLSDRTGTQGNLSVEPLFKDPATDNFRLRHASPGIDAGEGAVASVRDMAGSPRYDDPRSANTGTPAGNGAVPDLGAYEFVEDAPSAIDVMVVAVEGPSRVVAGEMARVTWVVANRGAEPFSGPWHDAIYLRSMSGGERLLAGEALVGRTVTLGPGQSRVVEADVRVPGGVLGDYAWVVEGNSRGDVFEGANVANNEGASTASTTLEVPGLVVDGPAVSAAFGAVEESQWFQCSAPAGKDVLVRLDLSAVSGITELYVGRGFVPTPAVYTSRQREFGVADTSVVVSGTGAAGTTNTFYVLAVGRVLEGPPEAFQIQASTAPFAIESIRQTRVGNAGRVTLEILGSGFQTRTLFTLSVGQTQRTADVVSLRQEGRAFATFDLKGLPPGIATLSANLDGLGVSQPQALEVVEGGTADFYADLAGPATTRAGRMTTWQVTYGNRGLVDVRLPMLRFSAPGATEIRLYDSTLNWADAFTFLALNPDVLLPTLGPGQEVTVEVRLKASGPMTVVLDVITGEQWMADASPFDWTSLPAPTGANAGAWGTMLGTLSQRLGANVSDYAALLGKDLDEIRTSPLRYTYLGNVNGRWLFGDEPETTPIAMPIIEIPPAWEAEADSPSLHGAPKKIPGDGIRRTWWVIITMEDYSLSRAAGVGAGDTPTVKADQLDLQTYARQDLRVPDSQITGAHDSTNEPGTWTRDNILAEIRKFQGKVDADDNLVIAYSGHGGRTDQGTGWLVANGGAVSPTAFTKAIDDVGAGTTYFINNSCHSEAFNEGVGPANTTFVGFAATQKDRVAWSTSAGSPMITRFKGQLRKCRGLGFSFELTQATVTHEYKKEAVEKHRQSPVLTNPTGASLEGKPWNDPAGFEQEFRRRLLNLPYQRWAQSILNIVGSVDPNDKYTKSGAGPEHWVQPGQMLPFEIVFENKTNAAAAAQEVLVVDQLDPKLDWSTFELKTIAFNDARVLVPSGLQRYTTTTQVGTDPYPVSVNVTFQPDTGRIEWLMRSLDTATGDLPEDPFAGFLPPNDASHRGEGSLTYVVRSRPDLTDGTTITNRAVIIFDPTYGANPPILTPWVTNTIDGLAPSSAMVSMPVEVEGETTVSWTGNDAAGGSGIASYDIYTSQDDGPYLAWLLATPETSARFSGVSGSQYRFYSVARDAAGNTEAAPAMPDTGTLVVGGVGPVAITLEGMTIRVMYTGVLQWSVNVQGPWEDVPGATSPFVTHAMPEGRRFFRARQ